MCLLSDNPEEKERSTQSDQEISRQLARAERDILRQFDPGVRAVLIAAVIVVLILTWLLPWIGNATGWQVLSGQTDPVLDVGLLPRLFAINSTIAGVGVGVLALVTRRWVVAFLAAALDTMVSFEGMIAIWSRQTSVYGGPSIGLVIALICMVVLAVTWVRIAWSRT